ncbi:DUF3256 family protein [Dysgonomonas sp. BGC7]|uniref:DUF3256 family protein n=1 Tax=Dysgonomonas sp. BGC7 TaxID=1658008 RepID=UPI00068101BA|nr:DUF3256 family protein [Dysgonomonas sp. BGC7]MBD8387810.1 DUF3256 family protein [Dysgonomonas sp. BGC7]
MKRVILILFISIVGLTSISGQNLNDLISSMPDNIVFGLDAGMKDMLIANPEDTAKLPIERGTYGSIKRLAISADYISLQTSDAGITQIKMLPLINDSKIVCVVKTVCGGICDSQVQFYTTKWLPINQKDLLPVITKDSFIKTDVDRNSQSFGNAYAALDMTAIKLSMSADNTTLTAKSEIKGYLSEEDYKKIEPYLIDEPIILNWDKISFK